MATATEPRIIHRLNVWQLPDGSHESEGVRLKQEDIGNIRGGGTCPDPFRIELTPLYKAAPEMLAALQYVADLTGTALTKEQAATLRKRCRAAIAATQPGHTPLRTLTDYVVEITDGNEFHVMRIDSEAFPTRAKAEAEAARRCQEATDGTWMPTGGVLPNRDMRS